MKVERIDHVNIRIPKEEVETALKFYRDLLGFQPEKLEKYRDDERTSFAFRAGKTTMVHVRPVEDFQEPEETNFDHYCFITKDFEIIKEKIEESSTKILRESNPWGSKGRAKAIYIKDPFNYKIEIKEHM